MYWFKRDGFKRKWMGRLLVVLAGAAAQPQQVQREKSLQWVDSATRTAIDKIFAPYATQNSPGYVLGLIKNGNLVFAKGYGQANLDDGIALTPRTAFHLASLSKQFTGAAVALLILAGKLSLEDPVSKYIPETAKYGGNLRIKHLVYMTSGLPEYTDLPRQSGLPWMAFYYFTRNEAISAALKPDNLEFPPGAQWAYRNINYMILTRIVEKISGQPYAAFMREKVFRPLGIALPDMRRGRTLR
jgi:CubicO group peptidase (beta-lactamase class C family)